MMKLAKRIRNWYRSRTIWLALLQAVGGILLVVVAEYPEAGGILIAKSFIDIALRAVTVKPIR